jgi:hypothetical protein
MPALGKHQVDVLEPAEMATGKSLLVRDQKIPGASREPGGKRALEMNDDVGTPGARNKLEQPGRKRPPGRRGVDNKPLAFER